MSQPARRFTWIALAAFALALGLPVHGSESSGSKGRKGKTSSADKEKTKAEDDKEKKSEETAKKEAQEKKEKTAAAAAAKPPEPGPPARPPGWDQGKKDGWKSEVPPGWEKLSDEQKSKWNDDVESAKEEVGDRADVKGLSETPKLRLQEAVERLSRKGQDPKEAKEKALRAVNNGQDAVALLKENGIPVEAGE